MNIDDMFDDNEDRDISRSLAGKVEKQEPVAEVVYSAMFGLSVRTLNKSILAEGTKLFTAPQPCPECAEKQSAIDDMKASVEGANCLAQLACRSEAEYREQVEELATQVEKMLNPADVLLEIVVRIQPFALPREEDTQQKRYERLRKAYCIAQPWPIPDQACLVWRADLMHMAGDLVHKQAYFDNEKRKRDSALAADMEAGK